MPFNDQTSSTTSPNRGTSVGSAKIIARIEEIRHDLFSLDPYSKEEQEAGK